MAYPNIQTRRWTNKSGQVTEFRYRIWRDGRQILIDKTRFDPGTAKFRLWYAKAEIKALGANSVRTISALIQRYKEEDAPYLAIKNKSDANNHLDKIEKEWGAISASAISPQMCLKLMDIFAATPRTANYVRGRLGEIMRFAEVIGWRAVGTNPTVPVPRMARVVKDIKPWPYDVQEKFLALAPRHLADLMRFCLEGGCAVGDAMRISRRNINNRQCAIIFKRAKTKAPSIIPITPVIRDILDRHLQLLNERERRNANAADLDTPVLHAINGKAPWSKSSLSSAMRRMKSKRENEDGWLTPYSPHGWRKSWSVEATEAGVDKNTRRVVQGHTTDSMADYYAMDAIEVERAHAAARDLNKYRHERSQSGQKSTEPAVNSTKTQDTVPNNEPGT